MGLGRKGAWSGAFARGINSFYPSQKFGAGSWRYVETREVALGPEPQWLAFDVTDALRFWLAGHGERWG